MWRVLTADSVVVSGPDSVMETKFRSMSPQRLLLPRRSLTLKLLHVGSVQNPTCEGQKPSKLRVQSERLGSSNERLR